MAFYGLHLWQAYQMKRARFAIRMLTFNIRPCPLT